MEIKNCKGTHDVLAEEANSVNAIEGLLKNIASLFNYKEIRTPIIEPSELFIRGVGESSDVVRKEMYTFLDKGDRSITLRPEFTASIIRSIVNNKLYATNELPLKFVYCGPVFRYDRPQQGRYRQFSQFGIECVGHDSYACDVETIIMAYTMLQSLGLTNVKVLLNSIGDEESREAYKVALKEYFAKYIDNMCSDCKERFKLNPLRILDCKVPEDQEIVKGAPKMSDFLTKKCQDRFNQVLYCLQAMGIPCEIDDNLVRGLDYYSETVFEFHYISKAGNDYGALGGGGHYSNLLKELGGPDLPGIGFSFGIERLYNVLKDDELLINDEDSLVAYVMPLGESALAPAINVATILRLAGYNVDMCFDTPKLGAMFKRAEKKNAKYALILGENELNNNVVVVKNMTTQEQVEVPIDNLVHYFDGLYGEEEQCHCHDHENEHECCCGGHHEHEHEGGCCCGHHHEEDK